MTPEISAYLLFLMKIITEYADHKPTCNKHHLEPCNCGFGRKQVEIIKRRPTIKNGWGKLV